MKKQWGLIIGIIILVIIVVTSNKYNNSDIKYKIITDSNIINSLEINNEEERGYELIEQENFYYLIIKHGEEPHYFSRLEVTQVEVNGTNLKVYVQLPKNDGMGDAFSYPIALLKLDKRPTRVNIVHE